MPFPGENVPQNTLASYDMIGSLQFGKKLLLSLHRSGCKKAPCLLPMPFYGMTNECINKIFGQNANANGSVSGNRYLSILEHFDNWPFGHRACFIRTETGSIFDTLIYIIFLQITKWEWKQNRKLTIHSMYLLCYRWVGILTFKASRFVFAFICGIQNRRELNAALSKLNRFLLKTIKTKI